MKLRLTGATFDASAQTVTHTSFSDITLAGIQLIVNVTDQIIIYNFADTTKGGTLSTDTLTLEYDTTTMSDTDELMILVDDAATTTAVSGTVTANLSATDNAVLDAIEADTTTLAGAVSGTEMQVDVVTSALPTGASTAANQTTIIGHLDGVEGLLTTIDADTSNLSVVGGGTEAAAIRVTIASDSTGVLSIDDNGGAITVDGTVTANLSATDNAVLDAIEADTTTLAGAVSGTEMQVDVITMPTVTVNSHAVTNAGTFAVQVDGSALTALQVIDNPVLVDDAAFTPATSSVMMAGFEADEASTDSVDEGDAGAARMTLDRKLIVTPQPHTAGGLSIFRSIDLDETEEEVKASAGQVYAMWVTNTATTTRFIKFYNATAANVTVGTTTPVITIGIPGNTSDDISGNFGPGGIGVSFDTAISVAATTGVADNDTGAPGANEVIVNIFYK